jgi:hypothetical protein
MITLILLILFILSGIVYAQPDTLWTRYFNDGEDGYREECYRLIQTDDGGFLIGGRTHTGEYPAYYVVKTDSDGLEEWSRCYDISDRHDFLGGITQTTNGQYLIAGGYQQGSWYANILKIDSNGDSLWSISLENGDFYNVIRTLDGHILACGDRGTYLVKVTTDGDLVWRRNYNVGGAGIFFEIIETLDSGYVAVGRVWPSLCLILKVDSDGEQEWMHTFDFIDGEETFFCVNELVDGGYLVGGTIAWDDALLVRFSSDGDTIWTRRGIPDFRERIADIVPAQGGGFVIVGGAGSMNNRYDIMRVDDLGEEVWDFNVEFDGSASFDEATSIVALDDASVMSSFNSRIKA